MSQKNVYVFQIYFDEQTRRRLDPHFIPLDNSENLRPDWCEYWPIRWTLLNNQFSAGDFIGFLSPRFYEKTACTGQELLEKVDSVDADVYSFSPFMEQAALFRSSFEQGDLAHPGLMDATERVFRRIGLDFDVRGAVFDHSTTIFSNYFVARHEVWLGWLNIAEQIFAIVEKGEEEIGRRLAEATWHRGQQQIPLKVFLMERLISVVLEKLSLRAHLCLDADRALTPSHPYWKNHVHELLECDELKSMYRKTGDIRYMETYAQLRQKLFTGFNNSLALASNNARRSAQ